MTTDPAALSHLRHELRTPLNHIIGYSEMLLEETDDARPAALVPALRRVHDEARQLLGLVNSVLGPSANETGVDLGRMAEALSPTLHRVVEASEALKQQATRAGASAPLLDDVERILVAAQRLVVLVLPAESAAARPSSTAQEGAAADADRKSTRLNSSHIQKSRMPSSA